MAEKRSLSAQQGLVGVRLAEEANLVTLYKVLGGDAPAAATTATAAVATSPSPAKSE